MSKDLNPDRALIFRITHRDNFPWILKSGLHCRNSKEFDPSFVNIGNTELIAKRKEHSVPRPPGGTLSDYVPFYFTPHSPMLYNIHTGYGGIKKRSNEEIIILVSSLRLLDEKGLRFLFTDRHAYLAAAQYYSELSQLDQIDWNSLQQRDFKKDVDNLEKFERYQAEALVHKLLPVDALLGVVCYSDSVASTLKANIAEQNASVRVVTKPAWYF